MATSTEKRDKSQNERPRIWRTASEWSIDQFAPAPENETLLYRPVRPDDPEIIELAESIKKHGILDSLVATLDFYVLSGHRRLCAAKLAGLKSVPARLVSISREDDPDQFLTLLREFNRSRDKNADEKVREELISADPEEAHRWLLEYRKRKSALSVETIDLGRRTRRAAFSRGKLPFVEAIKRVINENRDYWPLSDRRIHYLLLNDPPLRHSTKGESSRYRNDVPSYKDLTGVLTRMRIAGVVPMRCIDDETRPFDSWEVYEDTRAFIRSQLDGLCKGYYRDLMVSQPNHVELLVEKNTVRPIVHPIAAEYTIPLTSGRGFASLPPRAKMVERFKKSGKLRLVVLVISDHDPEGESIASSFTKSIRDDFGVENVDGVKVALTREQVDQFDLPPEMTAKEGSSRRAGFVARHGEHVWELEALAPTDLQQIVRDTINSVIDIDAFNAEIDREKEEAAELDVLRRRFRKALVGLADLSDDDEDDPFGFGYRGDDDESE